MGIKVKITPADDGLSEAAPAPGMIKIKIISDSPEPVTVELNARRALNGDIMIFDHDLIDIVVSPGKSKIVTFPKELMEREVYPTQDRFYHFLRRKGIIDPSSVQSGNIYSSLEAAIYESKLEGIDAVQSALFATTLFIEEERPNIMARKSMSHDINMHMHDPDEENSTEFGEVPHSDKKGALDQRVRPYGFQYMYSVLRESEDK